MLNNACKKENLKNDRVGRRRFNTNLLTEQYPDITIYTDIPVRYWLRMTLGRIK